MSGKTCVIVSVCEACSGFSKADLDKMVSLLKQDPAVMVRTVKALCEKDSKKEILATDMTGCDRAVIVEWCGMTHTGSTPRLPKTIYPALVEMIDTSIASNKSGPTNIDRISVVIRQAVARLSLAEPLKERKLPFISKDVAIIGSNSKAIAAAKMLSSHGIKAKLVMPQTHPTKIEHVDVMDETNVECLSGIPGNFKICCTRKGQSVEIGAGAVLLVGERCFANVNPPKDSKIKVVPLENFNEYSGGKVKGMVFIDDLNTFNSKADPVIPSWHLLLEAAKTAAANKLADSICVVAKDVKAAGLLEFTWKEAAEAGVKFIRYDDKSRPKIEKGENLISVKDLVLGEALSLQSDVLVAPITTRPWEPVFIERLFIPSDWDFRARSRGPQRGLSQSSCDGVFLLGYSNFGKLTDQMEPELSSTVTQIMQLIRQGHHIVKAQVAEIVEGKCSACFTCVRTCPYRAAEMNESWKAEIIPEKCQGCGSCAAVCPSKAIELKNCTRPQIEREVASSLEVVM